MDIPRLISEGKEKLTKGKTWLMLNQPFFSIISSGLEFICANEEWPENTERYCATMMTDGLRVWWNAEFVSKLTQAEVTGVICHEVMHCVWMHMLRIGHRNGKIWNLAADYAINPMLLDAGMTLPSGEYKGLYEDKYRNWMAEAIYNDLMESAEKIEMEIDFGGDGTGQPQDGDNDGKPKKGKTKIWGTFIPPKNEDGSEMTEAKRADMMEEIKVKVQTAHDVAKSRGLLPGGLEGLIKAIGKPKINWKDYIQNWVSGRIPDNYSWRRPNRKWMTNHNIYMPAMQVNGAGIGFLSIDTSGSVSDEELKEYVREIVGVIELCNPDKLYIAQHDAIIQKVDLWESGDTFDRLKIKGRGGTCIQPIFKYLETLEEYPDWMICFTDMGICDYPRLEEAPSIPLLWCATGPDNAPFGTYLPIKDALAGGG